MKLPNGYGSVYKLSGKRRNPYRAMITKGYVKTKKGIKNDRITIGYYPTKGEALDALVAYHDHPYDIKVDSITFAGVYERWSEDHFKTLTNKSSHRSYIAAFKHSEPLHQMRFKDIRPNHLEGTIADATCGNATKSRMKSLYNLMYRYALKYDIAEKNYASLCNSVKVKTEKIKVPFSCDEVKKLWESIDKIPFVNIVLVGIYSGFRPTELVLIKNENIYLEEGFIIGGMKTEAGTNRKVPIHPDIKHLIEECYNPKNEFLFMDYNMFEKGIAPLSYDKYRNRFKKIMSALDMNHNPHETRHTFVTQAKKCEMNDYMLKLIVGHETRDVTDKVYTHWEIDDLIKEMKKIIY